MSCFEDLRKNLVRSLGEFLEPEEAQAEAECWLREGLGLDRTWMIVHGRDAVPEAMEHKVEAWMARRRTGEPWAYILGWAEFRGHRIGVTPSVLIPRPETELVLEAALETGRRLGVEHVCDIGTGSGILAIFMALETNWRVQASDLSPAALAVAKVNAQRLKAEITFHEGDLLSPIPDPLGLVVSNPPYVDPADEPGLQRELGFEPRMALFAPEAGLALSTQLLAQAWERRAWGCVLEIGAGQGAELCRRALELGWPQAECRSDWAGHDRILIVTR